MRENIQLSKYPFLQGCTKAIWLHYNSPELKSPISSESQMKFEKGKQVGILARQIYAGGIDLSKNETVWGQELIDATQEALNTDKRIFYEAAFETLDKTAMFKADIFVVSEKRTMLIEVKSSTDIKEPQHLLDIGFQYYVLTHSSYSGPPIEVYIAYLNKDYVLGEELDIEELFILENITSKVKSVQVLVNRYMTQFKTALSKKKSPNISIDTMCSLPYECSFKAHCWKGVPEHSVFNIGRIRKTKAMQLYQNNIIEPSQIPRDTKLTDAQWIEVDAAIEGKPSINKKEIRLFLDALNLDGPTFFMDFETVMYATPKYKGNRCYQQLCFQYCVLYRDSADSEIIRREYIADPSSDPRESFVTNLLKATEGDGFIIVYNESFEKSRLKELAILFPQFANEIEKRISRIRDLMYPFSKRYYYHPAMKGSHSIKKILPILVPEKELSYKGLSIANGAVAMSKYEIFNTLTYKEQLETKKALFEYCYTDTLSMIKIADALQELI